MRRFGILDRCRLRSKAGDAGTRTGKGCFPSASAMPSTISCMVQAGAETLYILMPDAGRSATAMQASAASPLYNKLFRLLPSPIQRKRPLSSVRIKRPTFPGSPSPYSVASRRIVSAIPDAWAISMARSSALYLDMAYAPTGLQGVFSS